MLTLEFIMCDIRMLHITRTFFGVNVMVGLFVVQFLIWEVPI